ncbi:Uncharacterized protein TCM_023368 [Theobroma cacao]|uniref:Uncharacterized protein n=1 Tax=Theobroma cacao TaxID=3641 RepID=A0A061EVB0_THECC|nr:Uncharacterized protein TCM_023368 [Theobroma cacao]
MVGKSLELLGMIRNKLLNGNVDPRSFQCPSCILPWDQTLRHGMSILGYYPGSFSVDPYSLNYAKMLPFEPILVPNTLTFQKLMHGDF